MSLPLPRLDDRTYEELVQEARARIPALCPSWTDHNPADPGVALIEMFAWLTEQLLYRIDRVPERNYEVFLKILNGAPEPGTATLRAPLAERIRRTVLSLQEQYRAVTPEDYEELVTSREAARAFGVRIRRARCVAQSNLESDDRDERTGKAPGHMSVVVLPDSPGEGAFQVDEALRKTIWTWLDPRRLITTRHHVVGPSFVRVAIEAKIVAESDAPPDLAAQAQAALRNYFDPLSGGPHGQGWPFGRAVYRSEVYELLDRLPGVDYVDKRLALRADRPGKPEPFKDAGVSVDPHELIAISVDRVGVK